MQIMIVIKVLSNTITAPIVVNVIDGGTPIANANNKTTLAFKKDDFALSLNGGTVATDTSGDVSDQQHDDDWIKTWY